MEAGAEAAGAEAACGSDSLTGKTGLGKLMEENIASIIREGESSRVLFMPGFTSRDEIAGEIAAFANSHGGIIIFGVEGRTGRVTGLSHDEIQNASRELWHAANEQVKPSLYITTDAGEAEGRKVLICRVPEGRSKPYKDIGGTIWVKEGTGRRRVTDNSEILGLFQSSGTYHADLAGVPETSVLDLDRTDVEIYLSRIFGKPLDDTDAPDEKLLDSLHITDGSGRLTAAGLLFFGSHPQRYMPGFVIKAVRFAGNDLGGIKYLDSRDIEGTIPRMFDDGMHWLQSWLRRPQNGKGFNTIGDLEIPEPVLEELLQNALIHSDLLKPAAIRLLIFDNRVEIINPGCLPGSQTVDDVRRGSSSPRNIQLVRFCLRTLPCRGLGSGIPRAFSLYRDIELVNSQSGNQFRAIIRRMPDDSYVSQSGQNVTDNGQNVPLNGQNVPVNGQNVSLNGQNVSLNGQNVSLNGHDATDNGHNITREIADIISSVPKRKTIIERWCAILACLTENNAASTEEMAGRLGVSSRTIKRDIVAMNSHIRVRWTGSQRSGHWEISAK